MRRWILAGLAGTLLIAGCSSDNASGGGGTTATAPGGTAVAAHDAATAGVYVVQEAGPATLTPSADGTATLTLRDARADSITFTDAEAPAAASAPNQDVLDALFDGTSGHDAALSFDAPTTSGTVVVTVLSGTWDEATGTLVYEVRPIEVSDISSPAVAARSGQSPATELPSDVVSSSLFIDPIESDRLVATCNLTIVNDTAWTGTISSIDKSDSNGMVDWDTPYTDGQQIASGQQASAESGAYAFGCGAKVTVSFNPLDYYAVIITMDDPVFSKSSWSCAAPPEIACDIEANKTDQPLNMTVTLKT